MAFVGPRSEFEAAQLSACGKQFAERLELGTFAEFVSAQRSVAAVRKARYPCVEFGHRHARYGRRDVGQVEVLMWGSERGEDEQRREFQRCRDVQELGNGEVVLPAGFDVLKDRTGNRIAWDCGSQILRALEAAHLPGCCDAGTNAGCCSEVCHLDSVSPC